MVTAPAVSLPCFEGPLDLLLALVRTNDIDVTDLPVAEITSQYLDYMDRAGELDIDLGSEFAYMAATLIHIKSQCLLTRDPEIAAREEDPRQDLVRQLMAHQQLRDGAAFLGQALEAGSAAWSRPATDEFGPEPEPAPGPAAPVNVLEVLRLAKRALETARTYKVVNPRESVTVRDMVLWLESHMADTRGPFDALALLETQPSPDHRSALFLAMLEMSKQARIEIEQPECFGPLRLTRMAGRLSRTSI